MAPFVPVHALLHPPRTARPARAAAPSRRPLARPRTLALALALTGLAGLTGGPRLVAAAPGAPGAAAPAARSGAAAAAPRPAAPVAARADGPTRFAQDPEAPVDPALYDDTVIRDVRITFDDPNWLAMPSCNRRIGGPGPPGGGAAAPATDAHATLVVDGVTLEDVGVRCKGNSSLSVNGPKKPLNVTTDAFVRGQDLWGFDVFNLNNGWSDASLLREVLALRMMRTFIPASRATFARVTIQGEMVGVYQLVEQIDGAWVDRWHPDDGGLVIKGDSPTQIAFDSSPLTWEGEALDAYRAGYEVKGPRAGEDEGYALLREMIRALDAPPAAGGLSDEAFADGIRAVLDVDGALWYLAAQNVTTNFDSYYVGKNYYLYRGRRDPRFDLVPWDLGLAFGLFGLRGPAGPGGSAAGVVEADPFAQIDQANRPLIRRLLAVPSFRADYVAHVRTLRDTVFDPAWVAELGGSYQDLIRDAVREEIAAQGSLTGSFTFEQFESNLTEDVAIGRRGRVPGIVPLVRARRAFLAGLPELAAPDLAVTEWEVRPAAPTAADAVTVRATLAGADAPAGVDLWARVDGGPERALPMTRAVDGSWRAVVPPQRAGREVTFAFRAATADGRAVFHPAPYRLAPLSYHVAGVALPFEGGGELVINELMADNQTTLADEAGEFEDWIELFNRGSAPIELTGRFLSDEAADPYAFPLPAGVLAPGARLVVWADGDVDQGPLHAPFRLARGGEAVVLASSTAILDHIEWRETLPTDVALGRVSDGADAWNLCGWPTPGRANRCDGAARPPAALYLPIARR